MSARPEIVIVGAGSVGMFLATRFSQTAHVKLVFRPGKALGWGGRVHLKGLEEKSYPVAASELSEHERIASKAIVIVACKAPQLWECLETLKPRLPADARIVLTQNGLGIHEQARRILPAARFGRLICWFGVRRDAPDTVEWAGKGAIDWASEDSAFEKEFASVLEEAGLVVRAAASVRVAEWRKALMNVSLNALTALGGVPNGAALDDPELRHSLNLLLEEAIAVARIQGVDFGDSDRREVIEAVRSVGRNFNSTQQDLAARRPTEVPWLNGEVVRLGRAAGIPTPANQVVMSVISALERRNSVGN